MIAKTAGAPARLVFARRPSGPGGAGVPMAPGSAAEQIGLVR